MKYDFTPKGVCSRGIHVELDGDVIRSVKFDGGCNGNTQGVAALAVGMTVDEYVKRCKGIKCGFKNTSCPDQLALALEEALAEQSTKYAGMAELADAPDLGSGTSVCRFNSCYPHHKNECIQRLWLLCSLVFYMPYI